MSRYTHFVSSNPYKSLDEDILKLLRLIRITNATGKVIQENYVALIEYYSKFITTRLPFGAYLKHLKHLFLNGQGMDNFIAFYHLKIWFNFLPANFWGDLKLTDNFPFIRERFFYFLKTQFENIDKFNPEKRLKYFNSYHIIGLLLFPKIYYLTLTMSRNSRALEFAITLTIDEFCRGYPNLLYSHPRNSKPYNMRLEEALPVILGQYDENLKDHFKLCSKPFLRHQNQTTIAPRDHHDHKTYTPGYCSQATLQGKCSLSREPKRQLTNNFGRG